jgi:carbon monoxide dehydrogenase subunit G
VISNSSRVEVYRIQQYVIKFVSDLRQVGDFFPGTPVFSTNKTTTS